MTILWIVLAFVAGSLFGAVAVSLLAAGNRAEQDFRGGEEPHNENDTEA
jgi:uncharacterized protein involved in exopolysaccharide biosynthesis